MRASGGVWHTGGASGNERIKGFQLWVALPPELELAAPQSQYLNALALPSAGPRASSQVNISGSKAPSLRPRA